MISQQQFDTSIQNHHKQLSDEQINHLQKEFLHNDIVILDSLLSPSLKENLESEAKSLLDRFGKRRDMQMKVTGNTPRHFYVVGRDAILNEGQVIPLFYASPVIRSFINNVIGSTIYPVPYQPEEYIIVSQQDAGDTHGWHWDDYTYALIWMVEAPDQEIGGWLEYIPNTEWHKEDPENVQKILKSQDITRKFIPQGTCYLLKANTTLHRITPLMEKTRRTVVVFTFATKEDAVKNISHETIEEIGYGAAVK